MCNEVVIVEELQGTWATGSTLYKITKRIELSNDIFNPHGTYKFLKNSNQESHYVRSKLDFFFNNQSQQSAKLFHR